MPDFLTEIQKDILIGSMLGDGNLALNPKNRSKNARLTIRRSIKDKDYLLWEAKEFTQFMTNNAVSEYSYFDDRTQKIYKGISLITRAAPALTNYFCQWYLDNVKIVPKNIILTPLILLIWFLDDGSAYYGKHGDVQFKLSTNGFSKEEVHFLRDKLVDRYSSKFSVNKNDHKFIITSYGDAAFNFIDEIDPILPECMSRKAKWRINHH